VLFDRAEAEGTDEAKAACQKAIDLMDTERDAEEIQTLQARLEKMK